VEVTIMSHIGQYRILRRIGAGGMGLVFLGEHMLLGRRAAIKTLLPTVAANREIVERFFNEARAASAISDPGVIQIFDFGYHVDGTAYIVMELLEGEALSARIDRLGRLPVAEALRLARQIAGSLAAAHARGIVHRDLKPDNIFLVHDSEAQGGERTKVLDFGICKVGTSDPALTQSGMMVGTPVYMSPEQCLGADNVDHRADIYAFGCLLFHMITGRPPFVGDVAGELIVAHLEEEPPTPSLYVTDVPFDVDAVLLRCLAKSAGDRYQSMTELQLVLGDLYAALDGTESSVAAVPPAIPLGKGFRSVYDGNFVAPAQGASRVSPAPTTRRLKPWAQSASRSLHAPAHASASAPAQDAFDIVPPRRVRRRVVFGSVLTACVIFGLWVTVRMVDRDGGDHGEAEAAPTIELPINATPAPTAPEIPAARDPAISPATAPAAQAASLATAPAAQAAPVATSDDCARRPVPEVAPSVAASEGPPAPRAARQEVTQSAAPPRPHPAVAAARSSPPSPPPPSASPAPASAPSPSPAAEDLYESR
jgi:serine/threonine protein kinase